MLSQLLHNVGLTRGRRRLLVLVLAWAGRRHLRRRQGRRFGGYRAGKEESGKDGQGVAD